MPQVGTDNLNMPSYKSHLEAALQYQSAIMFLNYKGKELADEIIQSCAAGLSVALGNSTAFSGCTIDRNGVKIATLRGSWAHATHVTAYRPSLSDWAYSEVSSTGHTVG